MTDVTNEPDPTDEDLDNQIEGEEVDEAGEDDESPDADDEA